MPYLPPSSPEPINISELDMLEQHKLFHGSIPGSELFDIPLVPIKRRVDRSSPLIMNTNSEPSVPHQPITFEQRKRESEFCHFCQLASFPYSTRFPVTITNDVDDTAIPADFTFIKSSILCEGVETAEEGFRSGCDCEDPTGCNTLKCLCLQDMEFSGESYAYESRGSSKDCLREQILDTRDAIYECHTECRCAATCQNTVVGRGRKLPLDIFKTKDRGWGMRNPCDG